MTLETLVAPTLPREEVTEIKPSEAIRLGILIGGPQGFGRMANLTYDDKNAVVSVDATCALGAMYLGFGGNLGDGSLNPDGYERFCAEETFHSCSDDHELRSTAAFAAHLNDEHRWTREEIADWLETLGL